MYVPQWYIRKVYPTSLHYVAYIIIYKKNEIYHLDSNPASSLEQQTLYLDYLVHYYINSTIYVKSHNIF